MGTKKLAKKDTTQERKCILVGYYGKCFVKKKEIRERSSQSLKAGLYYTTEKSSIQQFLGLESILGKTSKQKTQHNKEKKRSSDLCVFDGFDDMSRDQLVVKFVTLKSKLQSITLKSNFLPNGFQLTDWFSHGLGGGMKDNWISQRVFGHNQEQQEEITSIQQPNRVAEIKGTNVKEIMTPLVDVVLADFGDIVLMIMVFEGRIDYNIVGVAIAMDLLDLVQKVVIITSKYMHERSNWSSETPNYRMSNQRALNHIQEADFLCRLFLQQSKDTSQQRKEKKKVVRFICQNLETLKSKEGFPTDWFSPWLGIAFGLNQQQQQQMMSIQQTNRAFLSMRMLKVVVGLKGKRVAELIQAIEEEGKVYIKFMSHFFSKFHSFHCHSNGRNLFSHYLGGPHESNLTPASGWLEKESNSTVRHKDFYDIEEMGQNGHQKAWLFLQQSKDTAQERKEKVIRFMCF
ncbi:unnamed protein product [Lactuca saligna]|uniref:Uncharacterized protein n=1 Tax=Lactuca saligna TaxID=75948 RepID=A0AA35Z8I8_LACSI|nr:unnamed protein product [Lactuca saligna]